MRYGSASTMSKGLLLVASSVLSACSGMTMSCAKLEQVDQELLKPCPEKVLAENVGWMKAHEMNTVADEVCRTYHENLIKAVEDLNDVEDN